MKLWSGVLSPFSAKVRIVLAEKGLDFEILEVPWSRERLWGPKPETFLAVSPRGEVPVLLDGPLALHDSTVILEYLEDRHPEPPLYPREAVARARCRMLEDEADHALGEEVTPLVQEVFMKPLEQRDARRIKAASEALHERYARLEHELREKEHLCGPFGVADVATFLVTGFATTLGVPPGEAQPRLRAWTERVGARPAVAREFAAMTRAAAAA